MTIPALPAYLIIDLAAKLRQRGGTIIDQRVHDMVDHVVRLVSPGGYRPARCPNCGSFPHSHGTRWRVLRDEPGIPGADIRRYLCNGCGGVWQVLPAFIPRYLHRTWGAVQSHLVAGNALESTGAEWSVSPKPGTLRRWRKRLSASAGALRTAMAASSQQVSMALECLDANCTHGELVEAVAHTGLAKAQRKLERVACAIHGLGKARLV